MPRTIDGIMAAHHAASALRAAGKPIWTYTVDIKSIIKEDRTNVTPEHIADVSRRIAKMLRKGLPASMFDMSNPEYDFDFVETVEFMEECTVESLAVDLENGATAVEMLTQWLDSIYDWAGQARVWLGS